MTQFEFVFLLYMLILGLSFVELLTGFGNAVEKRLEAQAAGTQFKIGWLTPLLGAFVMLDLLSFWAFAWAVREYIAVSTATLMGVMVFASSYFFAARLVFPRNVDAHAELDTHYFRIRRIVLGILIALVVIQWIYISFQPELWDRSINLTTVSLTIALIVFMAAAAWVRNVRWNIALLVLLILRYAVIYLI